MADIKKILTRVKDYVTQEDNSLQDNIDAEERARIATINALDLDQVGDAGNYIKYISQEDGQVTAQKQAFDTDMTNATDDNAPTTKNVKDYVDNAIDNLDKAEVGEDGKYIKKIKEDNGIITATLKEFDTLIDNSADNTNTPTTKAVKDYIDAEIDKLDSSVGDNTKVITGLTITNGKITANTERTITSTIEGNASNIPTDNAVKTYVDANINELDLSQVGDDGNYIKFVSQEDGQIAAQKQAFDITIDTNSDNTNAPTSKAVKDHVQAEINKLDAASQGGDGKYIRAILEENGKISATSQDFDIDFTNPSNNNAPTTQAVKNLIDSLDANQVGQNGYYIKTVSEENGVVTATKEAFEISIPDSNPSEVLAPTVKAVKNYVDTEIGKLDANLGNAAHLISIIKEVDGKLTEVAGPEILETINTSTNIPTSGAVKTYADDIKTGLQDQIDNLKSVQNVVEVVATKAALDQLDKTRYDENDKVQVIKDETQHDATTVYRLTNNIWDYVGSYGGDSYTKTQANERFVQKTFEINGHALSGSSIELNQDDIGLENVDNTSDMAKPVSTAQQTALNGKVDKTTTINGHALNSNITLDQGDVGLGNVDNTSDANKPISTATQSALDLKADKSTTYTKTEINTKLANIPLTLSYENAELYEVFNDGRTQTVVTAAKLKTDMSLNNVTNDRQIKGLASGTTNRHIVAWGSDGYTVADSGKTFVTSVDSSSTNAQVPTAKAVQDNLVLKEELSNKITSWSAIPSDDKYPSEKLVKAELDDKIGKFEPVVAVQYGPWSEGLEPTEITLCYAKKDLDTEEWSFAPLFTIPQLRTDLGFLTAFQNNPDNAHFVSEKLVKDSLDEKVDITARNYWDNSQDEIGYNTIKTVSLGVPGITNPNNTHYLLLRSDNGEYDSTNVTLTPQEFEVTNATGDYGDYGYLSVKSRSVKLGAESSYGHGEGSEGVYIELDGGSDIVFRRDMRDDDPLSDNDGPNRLSLFRDLRFVPDVVWSRHNTYAIGDIIFYNRALYICTTTISSATNTTPANDTTHWTKLFTNQA